MKDPKEMTIEEITAALDNLAHIDRMTKEDTSYLNAINAELRRRREEKEKEIGLIRKPWYMGHNDI